MTKRSLPPPGARPAPAAAPANKNRKAGRIDAAHAFFAAYCCQNLKPCPRGGASSPGSTPMGVEPDDGAHPLVDLLPTPRRPSPSQRLVRARMTGEHHDSRPLGQRHIFEMIEGKTRQHHGFETGSPSRSARMRAADRIRGRDRPARWNRAAAFPAGRCSNRSTRCGAAPAGKPHDRGIAGCLRRASRG